MKPVIDRLTKALADYQSACAKPDLARIVAWRQGRWQGLKDALEMVKNVLEDHDNKERMDGE